MSASNLSKFSQTIIKGYPAEEGSLVLGAGMLDGTAHAEARIQIPLKTLNRHGLVAGATGTGKTKTLQILAEQLSMAGVPTLVMDIKGDLSGLAMPGEEKDFITKRHQEIGFAYTAAASPVELLTLSGSKGIKLRATVSEFGPLLMARILDLNETQAGILAVLFQFCDDHGLLLLDLKDLKAALNFINNDGKAEFQGSYGTVSSQSIGTMLRKIVALEGQGAKQFFGERSFEIEDLQRIDQQGRGIISILRLDDIQDRPALFSTFMLQLLAEVYSKMPEAGDLPAPKLCIFIDEAHLVFKNASKALLQEIETIVKLIRSKAVGIFFVTQNPTDIPDAVLSQLGLKVQHALRAFTAKDRKAIKQAAENFPESSFYDTDELLTQMGIGEALVTALSIKGRPTPLVWTMLRAPASRMGPLSAKEVQAVLDESTRLAYYNENIDRQSAYEILSSKAEQVSAESESSAKKPVQRPKKDDKSTLEKVIDSKIARDVGRTVAREITRGLLGILGIKRRR
ncbi:MAG: DUF853 family protein [Leptospiraceae bacterium]|nr:DUF853 family protein [Leptospiraceae bacterium]